MYDVGVKERPALISGQLTNGIRFEDLNAKAQVDKRIQICSGTKLAQRETYVTTATVPQGDWRALSQHETRCIDWQGSSEEQLEVETVSILKLPDHIYENYVFVADAIRKHNKQTVVNNLFNHPNYRRANLALQEFLISVGAASGLRHLGHNSRPAGRTSGEPSTSVNSDDKFVGLHVDSWNSDSVVARAAGYPNRLCVNLGPEDRHLQFINLSLRQICRLSNRRWSDDPNTFVCDFFNQYPNYPVLKIKVAPGEAYVAPTEIMIHDGSTVGKTFIDVQVTFLGSFTKAIINRICEAAL